MLAICLFTIYFITLLCLYFDTPYYPQTDRQTKRVNQELEQYLRLYCNYWQNDWAE